MEIENNGMLPFLGTQLLNKSTQIQTKVYLKPTNTGLLLQYKSHSHLPQTPVDKPHPFAVKFSPKSGMQVIYENIKEETCKFSPQILK